MKTVSLLVLASIAGYALQGAQSGVNAHTKALQTAQALEATFTMTKLPAAPVTCRIAYSKPNLFVIETPETLTVCDGKALRELDKATNTYTETPAALAPTNSAVVFAWAAFFHPDALKDAKNITPGAKRTIKGNAVQEWNMQMPGNRTVTLYIDQKLGFARGASVKVGDTETLCMASDIKAGESALDASVFAWNPPAGAKLAEKPKPVEVKYSEIDTIFTANCKFCHGTSGGVNLETYASTMAGKRGNPIVVPGDPDRSALYRAVRSGSMPKMAAKLSDDKIKKIENWILGGAKE